MGKWYVLYYVTFTTIKKIKKKKRSGQSRQLLYFLDKETINLRGTDRTKKLRFGCLIRCLISKEFKQSLGLGNKLVKNQQGLFVTRISFYLLVQGGQFSHGRNICH